MTHRYLRPLALLAWQPRVRNVVLSLIYGSILTACLLLAFLLRFDFELPEWVRANLVTTCAVAVGVKLICMAAFRQFDGLLTYFSTPDLKRLAGACALSSLVLGLIRLVTGLDWAPPRGVILTDLVLGLMALSATRLGFRHFRTLASERPQKSGGKVRRVGIVGAGDTGATLARELLEKPWLARKPVAFFDDHRRTKSSIHGVPVVGRPDTIQEFKEKLGIEEIIIAMPRASVKRIREVVSFAKRAALPCRTVPALDQLALGRVKVSSLRTVEIHDLLGRVPIVIEDQALRELVHGQVVLVTGAGGSIGSELCRQILALGPSKLILVERSEPQLFLIEQELLASPHGERVVPVVADITHGARMRELFGRWQPRVLFHAAAHKHVPMMEAQPGEAIRNNVFGTAFLGELAIEFGVERFVFISTDKAVNPTSVMGATKRFAEIYLQSLTTRTHRTKFMAVRFGNVLGSSGSVVPTFARQIAAGGPITVTDPEMTRFFMTIPEAVTLVLQAATLGKGGNVFVLDMGEPVKILDLARQMITLSGLRPNEDIEIVFTGLRPGEKLYEELSHHAENVTRTEHPKIMRLISSPQNYDYIRPFFEELMMAISDDALGHDGLKQLLMKTIPEYTPFSLSTPSTRRELPRRSPPDGALIQLQPGR
ncbi:MAG: polysaccharide biosynthesis protein [Chthoniobacter sp.]|nr:polysaccharide biosynthesis protein [Chthoniobacter sp.]